MSIDAEESSSRSRSESVGLEYGQTYLDAQQAANQQQLAQNYLNRMGNWNPMRQYGLRGSQQGTGRALYQQRNVSGQADIANQFAQQSMGQLSQFTDPFNNPFVQQQVGQLGQDIGRFFNEQIMPGINSNAQLAGQRGGTRQGVAQGIAAGRMAEQFQRGATSLYNNAYQQAARSSAAASQIGSNYAQGLHGVGAQYLSQVAPLTNVQSNIAAQNFNAQFQPFAIGQQVIGQPSVLSQNFGFDYSQSESRSKGKGFGVGFDTGE